MREVRGSIPGISVLGFFFSHMSRQLRFELFHISEIAKDHSLGPEHYDLYGKYKAKVWNPGQLSICWSSTAIAIPAIP
ncbi:hypothetical protein SLE2022_406610 [Rubroshorea leprosula]